MQARKRSLGTDEPLAVALLDKIRVSLEQTPEQSMQSMDEIEDVLLCVFYTLLPASLQETALTAVDHWYMRREVQYRRAVSSLLMHKQHRPVLDLFFALVEQHKEPVTLVSIPALDLPPLVCGILNVVLDFFAPD